MSPAQPAELLDEPQEDPHRRVGVEARPIYEILGMARAVVPRLVLEKLLPHEQHRDPRRGHEQAGRDPRAAAGVPVSAVGPACERRDARPYLAGIAAVRIDEIMVLEMDDRFPRGRKAWAP